jgi:hypothetical protein
MEVQKEMRYVSIVRLEIFRALWRCKMRRIPLSLALFVTLLSLSMISCEQMFTSNLFSSITHVTPTAAQIAEKTPTEMQAYVSSAANIATLAENSELKTQALETLAAVYNDSTASTADKQVAAAVAADISIQTVADAAAFSSSLLGAVAGAASDSSSTSSLESTAGVIDLVNSILPADIQSEITSGSTTPPESFTTMISAFIEAKAAYTALAASLTPTTTVSDTGTATTSYSYADNAGISSSDANEIAVNALVSCVIGSITDSSGSSTPEAIAQALWSAVTDINNATKYLSIDEDAIDVSGSGTVGRLISGSSLASLF